jgi:hypothetical protein
MYVEESSDASTPLSAIADATSAIARLISGDGSFPEAVNACLMHIGNSEPARKIQSIVNIASGIPTGTEPPGIPRKLSKRCRLWNPDDDARLLAALLRYGVGDWKRIAEFVGSGKTGSQCSQRWSRALNPSLSKEQWTEEEDGDLWDGVMTHGQHSWAKVAKRVQSRSDVQCRYRFDQLKRMKKFPDRPKVVREPLRLLTDPSQFSLVERIPPLIIRAEQRPVIVDDG